jgi:hypothetical protein
MLFVNDSSYWAVASGYAEDDLDGTYDGILASAALDAQALANARGAGAA